MARENRNYNLGFHWFSTSTTHLPNHTHLDRTIESSIKERFIRIILDTHHCHFSKCSSFVRLRYYALDDF